MMKIGNRMFDVKHECSVMGILNVTPDSCLLYTSPSPRDCS